MLLIYKTWKWSLKTLLPSQLTQIKSPENNLDLIEHYLFDGEIPTESLPYQKQFWWLLLYLHLIIHICFPIPTKIMLTSFF